jgi:hypothetical protein
MLPADRMMRNKKRQKSVYIRETVPYVYSTVNIFPVLGGTDVRLRFSVEAWAGSAVLVVLVRVLSSACAVGVRSRVTPVY